MAEEQLNQPTEDDSEDEQGGDSDGGGEGQDASPPPVSKPSLPEPTQEPVQLPVRSPKPTTQEPRPRPRAQPRVPKPTYEETPPAEEEDDGESIWRSQDSLMRRRLVQLKTMLQSLPEIEKKQINFIENLCDQDPTILNEPRLLFDLLVEMKKVDPRMIRRVVDIVFKEQDPGYPDDMYAPPYGQTGYGGRAPNPYDRSTFERPPYGSPPGQGDRYSYERPQAPPRHPTGMISMAEHERMIEIERRAAFMEAENRRLRTENRNPPAPAAPPAPPREQIVEIKRPVLSPDGTQVIDYQYEKIPVDVYRQQMSDDRNTKYMQMLVENRGPKTPEQNQEVTALRDQVAELKNMVAAKEKDKQFESVKSELGAQFQTATKNMMELQKRTDARLAEIEKNKGAGAPGGGIGDDAQIIVTEIREGSALTRHSLDKASGLLEKYMDMQVKAGTPNKPKRPADRSRYKEELDEEEVRILREELPDSDVEEG